MALITELIKFRLLIMPCCKHMLCWVNPRWPSYCPECGKHIYPKIKEDASLCPMYDPEAQLRTHR